MAKDGFVEAAARNSRNKGTNQSGRKSTLERKEPNHQIPMGGFFTDCR
jgi:hypothetical protein